jgi:hypothetical protein
MATTQSDDIPLSRWLVAAAYVGALFLIHFV